MRHLDRTSATVRAIYGEKVLWGDTEHLLANVVDLLAAANWQRSGRKSHKPKPIKRPGAKGQRRVGRDPIPISKFNDWWEAKGKEVSDRGN